MVTSRIGRVTALIATAVLLGVVATAAASDTAAHAPRQTTCFWIAESASKFGIGPNNAFPDSGAVYWAAKFTMPAGSRLILHGRFAHARYQSFNSYNATTNAPIDALDDVHTHPDRGSINPFIVGANRAATRRSYTIAFVDTPVPPRRAANTLYVGVAGQSVQEILYRVYVPDTFTRAGLTGGVDLPSVTLRLAGGQVETGQAACATLRSRRSGRFELTTLPAALYGPLRSPPGAAATFPAAPTPIFRAYYNTSFLVACGYEGKCGGRPVRSGGQYSNIDSDYMSAFVNRGFRAGPVLVLHGELPVTPQTGPDVTRMPAGQMRYWSMCQNESLYTTRGAGCVYDSEVPIDSHRRYTIVTSLPSDRPADATAACGVAWIPWPVRGDGDGHLDDGLLIVRNMLPSPGFHHAIQDTTVPGDERAVLGPYYPQGTYTTRAAFDRRHGCPRASVAPAPRRTAAVAAPWAPADIASSVGSGDFGTWRTDPFGLPSYRYTVNELTDPRARQPELAGGTGASSQVGNDHIVADAFNHGYVQLWSQDRRYEWTNRYDAADRHFAGGFGYLRIGRRVVSTLYDDRPAGSRTLRDFGIGYFHRATRADGTLIDEYVYAPFGNDPLLLHDVTITNETSQRRRVSWYEYWDVNPFDQATKTQIGTGPVRWLAAERVLATTQQPTALDRHPLTIFAAVLRGPAGGRFGDTGSFFGAGSRALPAAVAAGRRDGTLAPAAAQGTIGRAMFAFSTPLVLAPHASVTLRYAYGAAHAATIAGLVHRYRQAAAPLQTSERRWRVWLPQITFGSGRAWLSRELQWDAYTVRSGATYEDCRGRHIISQGGYYQYQYGFQGAFRDPLQIMLPMIYADPALARDVLVYSAEEQPSGGQIPYAMSELCRPFKFGNADDLDVWLLLAASEYGLATRDLALFHLPVTFAGGGRATLWQHLELAFHHQQSLLRADGGYAALDTGDWSDLSTTYLQMTESTLVDAEAAYIYPRLALLADALHDRGFAAQLRRAAASDLRVTRAQWTARGWYARGYAGDQVLGAGAIFGEEQPWAILAGAPAAVQARRLVASIRRYLTGIGAPAAIHGPSRIGSAQSPAADDPAVTEHSSPTTPGIGVNAAVFPGGSWYAVNGWLTWALGSLGGTVAGARRDAFSEFQRNTLTAHAVAYPAHWDGILSVDDVCHAFYSPTPAMCGAGLTTAYEGQVMHQPAWSLFDAIRLAGITPTESGMQIVPELPFHTFSLALPDVGVAYAGAIARGYVVTASTAPIRMAVAPPAGRRWQVDVNGRAVSAALRGGLLTFTMPMRAGRRSGWVIATSA